MADWMITTGVIVAIMLGSALGALVIALTPFFRKQKLREEQYETLRDIPPEKLTVEQKHMITKFETAPKMTFIQRYKTTALLGVLAGIALSLTAYSGILGSIPADAGAEVILPAFLQGFGLAGTVTALQNEAIKTT